MNEPHPELATSYLSDAELDAAEVTASYSTDEVELHRLARQTLPQLIREVRLHRIGDHPADRTAGSLTQGSRHPQPPPYPPRRTPGRNLDEITDLVTPDVLREVPQRAHPATADAPVR